MDLSGKKYVNVYNVQLLILFIWSIGAESVDKFFNQNIRSLEKVVVDVINNGELSFGDRKQYYQESRRMVIGLT